MFLNILRTLISSYSVRSLCALTFLLITSFVDASDVKLSTQKMTNTIYMISGKGGNIGVSVGSDGTFLIDDKYAPMTDAILSELKSIGGDVPKFVINTHWHGDHTGGNKNLGEKGSIIVAHDNVRKRLSKDNFIAAFLSRTPAQPKIALPVISFAKGLTFHLNDDTISVQHIPSSHTDGDSIIYFKNDNVLHTGDLFFNGFYPFIDTDHGGSLPGLIKGIDTLLNIVDDKTKIIPGHGPIATKAQLIDYRSMLKSAYKQLSKLKKEGKTVEQAIASKPLKALDKQWSRGLFTTDKWIGLIYGSL